MLAISAATVLSHTDKLTAAWLAAIGTDASGYGLGTVGATARAYKKAADLLVLVQALTDAGQEAALLSPALNFQTAVDAFLAMKPVVDSVMSAYHAVCGLTGLAGVTGLNTFATYYNTGGGSPWNCLFAPDFADLYYAWRKVYPSAANVYFEILQGAAFPQGVAKFVVTGAGTGTFTAGSAIVSAQATNGVKAFAGAFGQVTVSSFAGGTATVTVTGTWRKTDGTLITNQAGSVSVTGNGTFVLTPPVANALLVSVNASGIVVGAAMTGATIYVEAKRPSGRTAPPV